MQNQNFPNTDPNAQQTGGYNDFYGTNAAAGQPPMQANPILGDNSAAGSYDPNSFYNQAPATGFPTQMPAENYPQDLNMGMNQAPLYDPNQAPAAADTSSQSTFEEPKSGNKFLVIGVVVLILILLAVGGYIVFAYKDVLFGGGTPASTETSQTATDQSKQTSKTDTTQSGGATNTGSTDNSSCLAATPTKLVHTDLNETFAQKAKFYNETNVTCDWLKRSFAGKAGSVDQITGQCLKADICGLTIDSDSDGLTNIQEFNYQTDPLNADTDNDKIADGDEINVYNSDPKRSDTDGDTYVDSRELEFCYEPTISSTTLPLTDTTKGKLSMARQTEIKNKMVINPLHEPTITTLKATTDIAATINGYAKCEPSAATPTASTSTSTSTSTSVTGTATNTPVPSNVSSTETKPTSGNTTTPTTPAPTR